MDEALQFPLPSEAERRSLIALYLDQYISAAGTAEGGAGSGTRGGFFARLSALLRGRRLSADRIQRAAGQPLDASPVDAGHPISYHVLLCFMLPCVKIACVAVESLTVLLGSSEQSVVVLGPLRRDRFAYTCIGVGADV